MSHEMNNGRADSDEPPCDTLPSTTASRAQSKSNSVHYNAAATTKSSHHHHDGESSAANVRRRGRDDGTETAASNVGATSSSSAAATQALSESQAAFRAERQKILTGFRRMNPAQRLDVVYDMIQCLYPAERMYLDKLMEDVRPVDEQYFADFGRHANSRSVVKDYFKFGTPRDVLLHEGLRKSLVMDVAFLAPDAFAQADMIVDFLQRSEIEKYRFEEKDHAALMQLMVLFKYTVRHPAFKLHQRIEMQAVFDKLESVYYTARSRESANDTEAAAPLSEQQQRSNAPPISNVPKSSSTASTNAPPAPPVVGGQQSRTYNSTTRYPAR